MLKEDKVDIICDQCMFVNEIAIVNDREAKTRICEWCSHTLHLK